MGTKDNPGAYDCYAAARADEPLFTLLARDELAPVLVELWAERAEDLGKDPAKVLEARQLAGAMRAWRRAVEEREEEWAEEFGVRRGDVLRRVSQDAPEDAHLVRVLRLRPSGGRHGGSTVYVDWSCAGLLGGHQEACPVNPDWHRGASPVEVFRREHLPVYRGSAL